MHVYVYKRGREKHAYIFGREILKEYIWKTCIFFQNFPPERIYIGIYTHIYLPNDLNNSLVILNSN